MIQKLTIVAAADLVDVDIPLDEEKSNEDFENSLNEYQMIHKA